MDQLLMSLILKGIGMDVPSETIAMVDVSVDATG